MIQYTTGDILKTRAQALVNTVNCVGVMGRGVALQFKKRFPENFKAYRAACELGDVKPGHMFVYETGCLDYPTYIINFPTKRHWRGKSRMEDIESGLVALRDEVERRGIRSVALPPLGSGLGGLDWRAVRSRIDAALGDLDIAVTVFEPKQETVPAVAPEGSAPKMTEGRAALIGLMNRYISGLLDPFLTLLEVHKLMYFMQEAGQPLRLRFVAGHYGPYAENLRHVLQTVEGYFVSGFADGGEAPGKELTLVPGAVEDAQAFLAMHDATRERFDRVAELVEGFETPFGLELLSTVHWVVTRSDAATLEDTVAAVHAWSDRKRRFSPDQIRLALEVLRSKAWIHAA